RPASGISASHSTRPTRRLTRKLIAPCDWNTCVSCFSGRTRRKTRPDPWYVREGGLWMDKLDEGIKTLLDLGKRRGFLTFDQVNDFLPDEASSPERIHGLLETLDEMGIELINEDEAEARLLAAGLEDEPEDELAEEPAEDEEIELTPEEIDDL